MSSTPLDVSRLAQAGMEALRAGNPKIARETFEKIIAAGSVDSQVWLGAALARQAMNDFGAAHAALDRVLEREPQNVLAVLAKGDCYAAQGDGRAASSYYRDVLRIAPDPNRFPPDIAEGVRRAKATCDKIAADMVTHLKGQLTGVGYDENKASRRFADSLDMLAGVKQRYIEEPKTFFFSGLPQTGFYDRTEFDWLEAFEAHTDDIADELATVVNDEASFEPYVQLEADRPTRTHKLLGSRDWAALYLWRDGILDEENAKRFPKTLAALKLAPMDFADARAPMALFSRLTPGTRIDPHTGYVNTRLICHLPIVVPGKCFLRVGNETHEWRRGETCIFNDTVEHEAWNDSDQQRIVLLFSIWRPELTTDERRFVAALMRSAVTFSGGGA